MAVSVQKPRNKTSNWYIIALVFAQPCFTLPSHSSHSCNWDSGHFPPFLQQPCHPCSIHTWREALLGLPDLRLESHTTAFSLHLGPLLLLWEGQVSIHDQRSLCPTDDPISLRGYVSLGASVSSRYQVLQNWIRSNSAGFYRCFS